MRWNLEKDSWIFFFNSLSMAKKQQKKWKMEIDENGEKEAEKQFAEQSGTWFFRLLFPTLEEGNFLLIGIFFVFLLRLRRASCQTSVVDEKIWIERNSVEWPLKSSSMCIHVYQMSHNLTSLNIIDWQTNPNYAGSKWRNSIGRKSVIHSAQMEKRRKMLEETDGILYTPPPSGREQKLLPFAYPQTVYTTIYKRQQSGKNWIKKFFMWFEYEIFLLCGKKTDEE